MAHGILIKLYERNTSLRAPRTLFHCSSAINFLVVFAHTVDVVLRLVAMQEDGRNAVFLSDPLIPIERFPTLEMPGSIKEHL
jgi:hypothetical protein